MSEVFLRFSLDPAPAESEGGKKAAESFSKDFGAREHFESRPLVLGEGSGVAGEEEPRRLGEVPPGGFGARGPVARGVFHREIAPRSQVVVQALLEEASEVGTAAFVETGVAGEEGARAEDALPLGGRAPRGPAGGTSFFEPSPPASARVLRVENVPHCEPRSVASVEGRSMGVAGDARARDGRVEQPYPAVEGPRVLEVDRFRKLRKGRRRRKRAAPVNGPG